MSPVSKLKRIRRTVTEIGLWETAMRVGTSLSLRAFPVKLSTHPFDLEYGVNTSGLIAGPVLDSGHPHDRHITAYWGIAPSSFRYVVERWIGTLATDQRTCHDFAFVDIGCGKGRGVMLASSFPFLHITGVELNSALVSIAQQNLATWKARPHACDLINVVHADALDLTLPDTPALLYVFNPFDAHVTQLVLDRLLVLSKTRTEPIDILYITPDHAGLFEQSPAIRLLAQGRAPLTAAETAVDAFRTRALDFKIYRINPAQ